MKLAKHKVTPFQAIKLTCTSESEIQTLETTVSQHEEDSNRELFPVPRWEVQFLPTESSFVVLDAYIKKKTLCYGLAHVLRNPKQASFWKTPWDRVLLSCAVGILGTNPQG